VTTRAQTQTAIAIIGTMSVSSAWPGGV
jgi:hypothetical protein